MIFIGRLFATAMTLAVAALIVAGGAFIFGFTFTESLAIFGAGYIASDVWVTVGRQAEEYEEEAE